MRIQKCQSLSFKAKVGVEKEPGCINPAIDEFVEFLKTLGGEDVTHEVQAADYSVYCTSSRAGNVVRLSVNGKKAQALETLKKMIVQQTRKLNI